MYYQREHLVQYHDSFPVDITFCGEPLFTVTQFCINRLCFYSATTFIQIASIKKSYDFVCDHSFWHWNAQSLVLKYFFAFSISRKIWNKEEETYLALGIIERVSSVTSWKPRQNLYTYLYNTRFIPPDPTSFLYTTSHTPHSSIQWTWAHQSLEDFLLYSPFTHSCWISNPTCHVNVVLCDHPFASTSV